MPLSRSLVLWITNPPVPSANIYSALSLIPMPGGNDGTMLRGLVSRFRLVMEGLVLGTRPPPPRPVVPVAPVLPPPRVPFAPVPPVLPPRAPPALPPVAPPAVPPVVPPVEPPVRAAPLPGAPPAVPPPVDPPPVDPPPVPD